MIDIDKVKAGFAANPKFCQYAYHMPSPDGITPAAMCAVSALCARAGMSEELIGKFCDTVNSFIDFALPILQVEYGIPREVGEKIPAAFDQQPNEWRGVEAVIAMCERHNAAEAALIEQARGPISWSVASAPGEWESFDWPIAAFAAQTEE